MWWRPETPHKWSFTPKWEFQLEPNITHFGLSKLTHEIKMVDSGNLPNTVKILKIGTPEIITIIVVQLELLDFTV